MDHPALTELLKFVDGELAPTARARVAQHLEECTACHEQLRELSAVSAEIAAIDVELARNKQHTMAEQTAALRSRLHTMNVDDAMQRQPASHWRRSLAYAAALLILAGMGWMLLRPHAQASDESRALPNPAFTPGAVRQVSLGEICTANNDEVVRDVPAALEQRVFREYGLTHARTGDFEVDYLITPGLGGSDDVANLWPEPHASQWNSYVKDQLEDHLHHMVCRGQLPLDAAQKEIASNWIAAYKKYFHTDQPLRTHLHEDAPGHALQRLALLR